MRLPFIRRSTHERQVAKLEAEVAWVTADRDQYRSWHWNRCDCHDAWDKCSCASAGHPRDGSCTCCDLGTGICGPRPKLVAR